MNTPAPPPSTVPTVPVKAERASLIDFPTDFPIKVMGAQVAGFEAAIAAVAQRFDSSFDATRIERRPSSGGRYLGLTLTVRATSQEQLDELYRTLSSHPMVKVVL
jgi:uncharacterized protein